MADKSQGSFTGNANQSIAAVVPQTSEAPVTCASSHQPPVGQLPGQSGLELYGRAWDQEQKRLKEI